MLNWAMITITAERQQQLKATTTSKEWQQWSASTTSFGISLVSNQLIVPFTFNKSYHLNKQNFINKIPDKNHCTVYHATSWWTDFPLNLRTLIAVDEMTTHLPSIFHAYLQYITVCKYCIIWQTIQVITKNILHENAVLMNEKFYWCVGNRALHGHKCLGPARLLFFYFTQPGPARCSLSDRGLAQPIHTFID